MKASTTAEPTAQRNDRGTPRVPAIVSAFPDARSSLGRHAENRRLRSTTSAESQFASTTIGERISACQCVVAPRRGTTDGATRATTITSSHDRPGNARQPNAVGERQARARDADGDR